MKSIKWRYATFILLIVVSATPLAGLSYVVLLIALSKSLQIKAPVFFRLLLSMLIVYGLVISSGGISFILDTDYRHIITVILGIGLLLILNGKNYSLSQSLKLPRKSSVINVFFWSFIGVVFFSLLFIPALTGSPAQIFRLITFGGDNVSHIELIKIVGETGNYFYEVPETTKRVVSEGLSGYPQGYHLNFYAISETIKPVLDIYATNKRLVTVIYAYISATFVLLYILLYFVSSSLIKDKSKPAKAVVALLLLIPTAGILFSLFALGFHTQIMSLAIFVGMLYILHQSLNREDRSESINLLLIAAVFVVSISYTWLFLLPISVMIYLIALFFLARKYINPVKLIFLNKFIGFALILFGAIALLQPLVQILYKSDKLIGVNEIGFTQRPNILIVATFLSLALVVLINKKTRDSSVVWYSALASSVIFSVSIGAYNLFTVSELRYYYYKSLFTVLIICFIILSSYLIDILKPVFTSSRLNRNRITYIFILSCLVCAVAYNATNKNDYFYRRNTGGISQELTDTAMTSLSGNPDSRYALSIVSIGSCNRAQDYTITRLAGILGGENNEERQTLYTAMLTPSRQELREALIMYQENLKIDLNIYSTDRTLQKYVEEELKKTAENETYLDLDFADKEKTIAECPNYAR